MTGWFPFSNPSIKCRRGFVRNQRFNRLWVVLALLAAAGQGIAEAQEVERFIKVLDRDGEPVTDGEVEALAERWRPWRSYATAYIFAAMRSGMV
jgi:hypothetical protein